MQVSLTDASFRGPRGEPPFNNDSERLNHHVPDIPECSIFQAFLSAPICYLPTSRPVWNPKPELTRRSGHWWKLPKNDFVQVKKEEWIIGCSLKSLITARIRWFQRAFTTLRGMTGWVGKGPNSPTFFFFFFFFITPPRPTECIFLGKMAMPVIEPRTASCNLKVVADDNGKLRGGFRDSVKTWL